MRKFPVYIFFLFLSACVASHTDAYYGFRLSGAISKYDGQKIILRQLDMINALRREKGFQPLIVSNELNASAKTHALDIYNQKRAWNFGSDASSPQERGRVSGYDGIVSGENVSETYEGEFSVLQVWLKYPISRDVILNPLSTHFGLGWYQENDGKTWWVQDIGQANR